MSKPLEKTQSPKEELYNTISHAIAIPFGIFSMIYLWMNCVENRFIAYLGILLYGISFILLFTASTLYHVVKKPSLKKKFRILDHISIFLLIAGTYSPVVLIVLEESKGWLIFILVWSVALLGTLLKLFFTGKFEKISLILYMIMGWLVVIDFNNLIEKASAETLIYLGLGGLFYTIGAYFYANNKIPFNHVIWHIFVLVAALFHFFMVAEIIT
ncbi:PAQR family membrane homeostasis protein TrhA [Psychroflexus planctonicus]|uniref:Hemolysin D n=1 Tax=Psychroflexus planctonicus TaxID=1526575 RepID=A0ABQ1SE39_9FLAO|nr:hemolysin III family protein [Psychroflexus planctonicus]GGE29868.1 hemolysin D [Psychroflexus planctonicus]